jgi:oligoribonuclease
MDRRFLSAYLPEIEEYLHYRSIDVSSVKELVKRWYPEVAEQRTKGQGAHRALDDIRESVRELQYYRARVFRAAAAPLPALEPEVGAPGSATDGGR